MKGMLSNTRAPQITSGRGPSAPLRRHHLEFCCTAENLRKRKHATVACTAYSKATFSKVEEDTSSGSNEEDDWLLSDEEDEDEFSRNGPSNPSVVLERLQDGMSGVELTEEEKERDAESRACAIALAKIAWDTKAENVTVLHVAPLVYWCSYMVVATIKSRPQMQAVVAKVEQAAEQTWGRPISELARTQRGGEWEAIDLMDVVVHVFTADQRNRYSLDEYYGQAEIVDLPFMEDSDQALAWSKSMPR